MAAYQFKGEKGIKRFQVIKCCIYSNLKTPTANRFSCLGDEWKDKAGFAIQNYLN